MSTKPSLNLLELQDVFGKILSGEDFGEPTNDIAELIYLGQFSQRNLEDLLMEHNINDIRKIRIHLLDLVLCYITYSLEDNFLTAREAENVRYLKRIFKIQEGDFYQKKYSEIETILDRQFLLMYQNNKIDGIEALQKVQLQELFDLSNDQFLRLRNKFVSGSLDKGAEALDMETFMKF